VNNERPKLAWTSDCDCSRCRDMLQRVHREWVCRFRMPAVDFLTEEFGLERVARMMANERDAFEAAVRDMIAGVVSRQ